ncbi:hypothetical protein [Bowmanella denitrificans]|uniref:hypothetical protein n=1 Tax=Bowmanella denitrificans TaxID=366582 RepID=UPI000C9BC1A6|nr:hypothetical protein [Bowmanella denitrificans]
MSNIQPSQAVQSLVNDTKALIVFANQDIPGYRPDLQMKVAQEAGQRAMQLTAQLVDVIQSFDARLAQLEAASNA